MQASKIIPDFLIRDNQLWINKALWALIGHAGRLTFDIEGLGERTLERAATGKDGRETHSFLFALDSDKKWWRQHNKQKIRIEILEIGDSSVEPISAQKLASPAKEIPSTRSFENVTNLVTECTNSIAKEIDKPILCIGLDIAWWGGAMKNIDSQYDCLAWILMEPGKLPAAGYDRIQLPSRDPQATTIISHVDALLNRHSSARVIFAVDAPLQARERPELPARTSVPNSGMVTLRACEKLLNRQLKLIDIKRKNAAEFKPNIQPGAPLAPRVLAFRNALESRNFATWRPGLISSERLILECFPAEAIWAIHALGNYPNCTTGNSVKDYKHQQGKILKGHEVEKMVHQVLDPFAAETGIGANWISSVEGFLKWMLAEPTWANPDGTYKGGKLLDDAVDTFICLATALSYCTGKFHIWYDPMAPEDGHITGPGCLSEIQENKTAHSSAPKE